MPKPLVWRAEWSLHIETLDADHRALIDRLNAICRRYDRHSRFSGAKRPQREGALLDALTDLAAAARSHFQREEDFMLAYGYERIGEHTAEHALLMAEYSDMLREWREARLNWLDETAQTSLRHWLLAHILGPDRDFAQAYQRLLEDAPTLVNGRWLPPPPPSRASSLTA